MQTDFVFKRVFGSMKNKRILIRFLNALFEGQLCVTDVTYHDKEVIPDYEEGKTIIYDVYWTSMVSKEDSPFFPISQIKDVEKDYPADHHFILEMQNIYIPPFEERLVYYLCRAYLTRE